MNDTRQPILCTYSFMVAILLAAVIALGMGCESAPRMKAFNIDMDVSGNVDRSFTVDLVGLPSTNEPIAQLEVNRYFAAGSQHRADLFNSSTPPITRNIAADEEGVIQIMPVTHERWGQWREAGVMHLMVIVDRLAASSEEDYQVGSADTRRLIIPLDDSLWRNKGNRLTIEAMSTRLSYSPRPDEPN